jgi:hypothetical protein
VFVSRLCNISIRRRFGENSIFPISPITDFFISILCCNAVWTCRLLPTFLSNMLPVCLPCKWRQCGPLKRQAHAALQPRKNNQRRFLHRRVNLKCHIVLYYTRRRTEFTYGEKWFLVYVKHALCKQYLKLSSYVFGLRTLLFNHSSHYLASGCTSPPKEGVLRIFIAVKKSIASAAFKLPVCESKF